MMYTKEMLFSEFKDAAKKDQKGKKEKFTNRINYLKEIRELKEKQPKVFENIRITDQQFRNLIDGWSSENPRDYFYMKVFGRTFQEQLDHEERMDKLPKDLNGKDKKEKYF